MIRGVLDWTDLIPFAKQLVRIGSTAGGGGTVDHGLLLGLSDDDHSQYVLANGSRIVSSLMVGAGLVSPDGTLHVHTASAGSVTASTDGDDLIVEGNGNTGISILTPSTAVGSVLFGDTGASAVGAIKYSHVSDSMLFIQGSLERMRLTGGQLGIGTSTPTAGYLLDVTGGTNGIRGVGTTGPGIYGASTSSYGLYGYSTGATAISILRNSTNTNTVEEVAWFSREVGSGVGANGIGGKFVLKLEDNGGNIEDAASIIWSYSDAGHGTEGSFLAFYTRHGGAAAAEAVRIDDNKNLCIGGSIPEWTAGKPSKNLVLFNGEAPIDSVADGCMIYTEDGITSGLSSLYVRDESGNVTLLSPHDENGEWEYFSRNTKTGRTYRVKMERLVAAVERLTGEKFSEQSFAA